MFWCYIWQQCPGRFLWSCSVHNGICCPYFKGSSYLQCHWDCNLLFEVVYNTEGFTDIFIWEGRGDHFNSEPFGEYQSSELELKKGGTDSMHTGQFCRIRFWGYWSFWSRISWMCCWLSQASHTWSSAPSLILCSGLCWFLWTGNTKPGKTNSSAARGA